MITTTRSAVPRITGVIEYSADASAGFPLSGDRKADADRVLKANASWLAPNHYVPRMDRLIVTIQLWVLKVAAM